MCCPAADGRWAGDHPQVSRDSSFDQRIDLDGVLAEGVPPCIHGILIPDAVIPRVASCGQVTAGHIVFTASLTLLSLWATRNGRDTIGITFGDSGVVPVF